MDNIFGPPIPDPLEDIERSIEQPVLPGMEAYVDPLDSQLNAIESSIENQPLLKPITPDPLHQVLDNIESEIERQLIAPQPELPTSDELPLNNTPEFKSGNFSSKPLVPDYERLSPIKEYQQPVSRPKRGGTGIRSSGSDMNYCHLYESWVTQNDCSDCSDFEADDTEEGRCQHMFYDSYNGSCNQDG